jgi:hypothetical protein
MSKLSELPVFVRRIIRFIAIPYCFYQYINWDVCSKKKLHVVIDIIYIFFKFKYYPDNYYLCRLWNKPKNEWKYYYGSVYDANQRGKLRKEVLPFRYRIIYDNKIICQQLCKANNIPTPHILGVINDKNYKQILSHIILTHPGKKYIIKPTTGRGGKGIYIIYNENGQISYQDRYTKKQFDQMNIRTESIVQEYVEQHSEINKISMSINTIRIVTMQTRDGDILILGAFMRFGVGESLIDNTSQGGIKVGIDINTGNFMDTAYDKKGFQYNEHPTSKYRFQGFCVPFWTEVIELAKDVQINLAYNKLLGQDIAITKNGPIVVEINAEYDNVGLEQVCGPVLKNQKVLFAFQSYGLLINKYQDQLYNTERSNM